MRGFPLCEECLREYNDPHDRRFRAEPIACPKCGPRVWFEGDTEAASEEQGGEDAIGSAAAVLRAGGVIAVEGLGGFHLACDARSERAIERLRLIKHRPDKPLAVMAGSLDSARLLAELGSEEVALLASTRAPIVLVRRRADAPLAPSIAPGNDHIGLMLAYSPLHHLLLKDVGRPLVMTSANLPGEPLARDPEEARAGFEVVVDGLLMHDRPVHQRCDDAVWMVAARGPQPVRLSRGDTLRPIEIPIEASIPVLGIGGDIKNNFCLLEGRRALMSQYVGSMENAPTQLHCRDSLERWSRLLGIDPALVAHDLHPNSPARTVAEALGLPTIGVQHHHAHVAACMADNGFAESTIGVAFDGTGYGIDGAIWGGEVMIADFKGFRRIAHLEYLPLPGGDGAIRHPIRTAAAYLIELFGEIAEPKLRTRLGDEHLRIVTRMVERQINTVPTSSCGRLFDAVAALVAGRDHVTYEAQAAIELEVIARQAQGEAGCYPFEIAESVVSLRPLLAAILADLRAGVDSSVIARRFHRTVADIVTKMVLQAGREERVERVALTGGCFQNRLLLADCVESLEAHGFKVLTHSQVPANDGGLALGQAVVAAAQLKPSGGRG